MPKSPPGRTDRFEDLLEIVRLLRDPGGCPWDRAQSHVSLRQYLLEECHEALEAIDRREGESLVEELGDLLVHIAFHADIASRAGSWTAADLVRRSALKLVRRHPHVFTDGPQMASAEEVVGQWEALKTAERGARGVTDGVPGTLPALSLTASLQKRAAAAGIKSQDQAPAIRPERLAALAKENDRDTKERLAGQILEDAVTELREAGVDAETALRSAAYRLRDRLSEAERVAGRPLAELSERARARIWKGVRS